MAQSQECLLPYCSLQGCKVCICLKQWMLTMHSRPLSFCHTAGFLSFISSLVSCTPMATRRWRICSRTFKSRTQWTSCCLELETLDTCWRLSLDWRLVLSMQVVPTRWGKSQNSHCSMHSCRLLVKLALVLLTSTVILVLVIVYIENWRTTYVSDVIL